MIFIGTDAPDLVPAHLRAAADAVGSGRAVIGAAEDGGYWLLGLPDAVPGVFDGIAWSTGTVFTATLERLLAAGHDPVAAADAVRSRSARRSRALAGSRCVTIAGDAVAIVIPALDEAAVLPPPAPPSRTCSTRLRPKSSSSTAGSRDGTAGVAGFTVLSSARGRARQINAGVAAVHSPIVCVLHADTLLPDDAIAVIRRVMAEPGVALAGFTPVDLGAGEGALGDDGA